MKTIVVNATALDQSGALTILRQFVEAIPTNNARYLIFVSPDIIIDPVQQNVQLVPICNVKSFRRRFIWDVFGLKKWLKNNQIVPSVSISLQNTNFRTGYSTPNYIYYHQSIPFFDHKWSFWIPQERSLWFYKNVYPFFVRLFLSGKTHVFVQTEFIREGFARYFSFSKEKIHIISPKIIVPSVGQVKKENLDLTRINLFYPANPFFYKNHRILFDALACLDASRYTLYLTCRADEVEVGDCCADIRFLGAVSFEKMLGLYAGADALLFPSYIETFGLPLIEAASFGLPIITADLPYAREVLRGYFGVRYAGYKDIMAWADKISMLKKGERYEPFQLPKVASWSELFKIVE